MKKILKISLISIFFLTIYFLLFNSGLIKYLALGLSYYFSDYQAFVNGANCLNLGLSPYIGPAELNCKGFNYGHAILIFTPFKNFITGPYHFVMPLVFTSLFTISTIKIINPKNYFQFFVCSLALLNPATLLLIERMNLDILLYLIIIILAFNKIYFLNWLLVIYSFLFKFYPFVYGIIIFVEKEKRKISSLLFIFFFILFTSLIFIFLFRQEYSLMFKDSNSWKMGLHYLFSIKAIPKVLKESFSLHYGLMLLLFYLFFIIQIYKRSSKIGIIGQSKYTFEKKLFLLSSNSLLLCFLTFSNALYREVFLILIIPYFFSNFDIKEFRYILYVLCIKFLFNFIYTYDLNFETFYHLENVRIYKTHFLIISFMKGLIDYILMMLIGTITLKMNLDLINSYKKLKN